MQKEKKKYFSKLPSQKLKLKFSGKSLNALFNAFFFLKIPVKRNYFPLLFATCNQPIVLTQTSDLPPRISLLATRSRSEKRGRMRCKGVAYQKITSGKTKCKKGKKEEEERRKKGRRKNCARQANGNEKEEEEENRAKFEYKAV